MSKKYRRTRVYSIRSGAKPTKERQRQNGGIVAEVIDRDMTGKVLIKRYKAVWECPLDAYRDRAVISTPEYQAGLRFRQAYFNAVLSRKARYERLNNHTSDIDQTKSEQTLKEAYRTLSPHNKGAVIDICGHDQPAQDMRKLDALQRGLGQLSELWKTAASEVSDR